MSEYRTELTKTINNIQRLAFKEAAIMTINTFITKVHKLDYDYTDFEFTSKYKLGNVLAALLYKDSVSKRIFTRHQIRIGMMASPMYKEILMSHPNLSKMRVANLVN